MSSPFTPPHTELEIVGPSTIELLWTNHRRSILGGVGAVATLIVIVVAVLVSARTTRIASETALSLASGEAGWRMVISKYPRTPASADAMLLLAASLRDAGKLDESDSLYSRFTETFPRSPLAISGLLGRASNARVADHLENAINDYQQAAAGFPQSYGAPFALFNNGRLLAQQGKIEEAKRLFQTLGTQYPGSVMAQAAGVSSQATASIPQ